MSVYLYITIKYWPKAKNSPNIFFGIFGITNIFLYYLGDVLKHPNDDCTSCVCSSPPSLTCYSESCANFKIYGNADGCEAIKSPGSCCTQSLRCPKPDQGIIIYYLLTVKCDYYYLEIS